jgi:DNA-binding CsgD family transcriptional regulator
LAQAARCGDAIRERPSQARDLAAAAEALLLLADELSERALGERVRRLGECERGLARMREITTTAGLIDDVCDELIRSLGFARTMLARVEGGMWRPWKANASMLDEAWVGEWIDRSIPLDELTLETRLLREGRPELVLDTGVEGIAQMVRAAGVSSYVVAPIMPGGRVVGFLHADHGIDGRSCDVVDRDVLWMFAEGFGHRYEQASLLERLQARREQVRRTVAEVNAAMDALTEDALELTAHPEGGRALPTQPAIARQDLSQRLGQLTSRELQVLELVVAGARNSEIADGLVITVGTVKSHVKNVLSKLGVVNRSQAIALYLGADESGVRPLSPTR